MKRNHSLEIRVSKEELDKIKQKATETGMSISGFVRFISVHAKIEVSG